MKTVKFKRQRATCQTINNIWQRQHCQGAHKTLETLVSYRCSSSRFHLWAEKHKNKCVGDHKTLILMINIDFRVSGCVYEQVAATYNAARRKTLVGFSTGQLLWLGAAGAAHPAWVCFSNGNCQPPTASEFRAARPSKACLQTLLQFFFC